MSEERLTQIEQTLILLEQRLKTLEMDIEPKGRISEGFEYLANDIESFREETRKRLAKLEHGQSQIKATLDIIMRHVTGMVKLCQLIQNLNSDRFYLPINLSYSS